MILRSDSRALSQAGFTLFETLVSLAILSLALAVSSAALRGPSPTTLLQQHVAEVQKDAVRLRDQAIRTRTTITMDLEILTCDPAQTVAWFFPNGSAIGPDLCLTEETAETRLQLSPLLGRYTVESGT